MKLRGSGKEDIEEKDKGKEKTNRKEKTKISFILFSEDGIFGLE